MENPPYGDTDQAPFLGDYDRNGIPHLAGPHSGPVAEPEIPPQVIVIGHGHMDPGGGNPAIPNQDSPVMQGRAGIEDLAKKGRSDIGVKLDGIFLD